MRILRVDNNIKSINFEGRKNSNARIPKDHNGDWTGDFLESITSGDEKYKGNTNFELLLEAWKNKAVSYVKNPAPAAKSTKPLPFEQSDGKFILDRYQKEAIDSFTKENKTTLVPAPTGTGKTLIAKHAIKDALENGKRIIYLSPLKALSNEKYLDFARSFGNYDKDGNLIDTKNVGLITGDTVINGNAPVLVMTTEVYRNSLLQSDPKEADETYADYSGVIYDEFHYLGEPKRGTVWEEAISNTPKHMKQLFLSATASNSKEILGWIQQTNSEIPTHIVEISEDERHVPLRELALVKNQEGEIKFEDIKVQKLDLYRIKNKINLSDRQEETIQEIKEFLNFENDDEFNQYLDSLSQDKKTLPVDILAKDLEEKTAKKDKARSMAMILSNKNSTTYKKELQYDIPLNRPSTSEIIKALDKEQMTPALFYVFSKRQCDEELERVAKRGKNLLSEEEQKRVYEEIKKAQLEGIFLGADFSEVEFDGLMKGVAVHHAGKLPAYKSLVENLARQGLIKTCFATDTLIAGINMPFRTTVFTSSQKFNGEELSELTPQTYKQGGGRAGRRGKDDLGNVVVIPHDYEELEIFQELSKTKDTSINSQYRMSYASLLSDRTLNNTDETILNTFAAYQNDETLQKLDVDVQQKLARLEDLGYVEKDENGKYSRSPKGEIAKDVCGINEIVFTELLTEGYLKDFTSTELIAFCSAFADIKDEQPSKVFRGGLQYLNNENTENIFTMIDTVNEFEEDLGEYGNVTKFSTNISPYIVRFSEGSSDRQEAIENWKNIMEKLQDRELILHEGDFLRIINGTIDILKLVVALSPDKNLREEAAIAVDKLRKPPVTDIASYELDKNYSK